MPDFFSFRHVVIHLVDLSKDNLDTVVQFREWLAKEKIPFDTTNRTGSFVFGRPRFAKRAEEWLKEHGFNER